MTTQALQQQQGKEIIAIKQYLETARDKLAEVLPKYLTPERLIRVAVAALSRAPKLALCTRESILLAIMEAGQLGLEAGSPLGHAYLVPFENRKAGRIEATLIIGYKGLIELARRSGQVACAEARVVYAGDVFDCEYGLHPRLTHRPCWTADRGQPLLAYAIIRMKGEGEDAITEVMTRDDIERIRARSRAGTDGPWVTDWDMMARKTVLRRALKYAPMPTALADALEHDADERAIETTATVVTAAPPVPAPDPVPDPAPAGPPGDPRAEAAKDRIRGKRRQVTVEMPDGTPLNPAEETAAAAAAPDRAPATDAPAPPAATVVT